MIKRPRKRKLIASELFIRDGQVVAPLLGNDPGVFNGILPAPRIGEAHAFSPEVLAKLQSLLTTFQFQEIGALQFLCQAHDTVDSKLFLLHLKNLATVAAEDREKLIEDVATKVKE